MDGKAYPQLLLTGFGLFLPIEQDTHLDRLSHSINRQRDMSLQINDELSVHQGLLGELDTDIDRTGHRLGSARKRLNTFAEGAKKNGMFLCEHVH